MSVGTPLAGSACSNGTVDTRVTDIAEGEHADPDRIGSNVGSATSTEITHQVEREHSGSNGGDDCEQSVHAEYMTLANLIGRSNPGLVALKVTSSGMS